MFEITFLVNAIILLLIVFTLSINLTSAKNKTKIRGYFWWVSVIILSAIIILFFSIYWVVNNNYTNLDFTVICFLFFASQAFFMLKIVYSLEHNKKLFYLILIYLITFVSSPFSAEKTIIMGSIASLILILYFSYNLSSKYKISKKAGNLGIFYSSIAIILNSLLLFFDMNPILANLLPNFLFLIFINRLTKDLEHYPIKSKNKIYKQKSNFTLFIKYFIFIILVTIIIFLSTIGIHEIGHLITSELYGCESRIIFFEDSSYPHTEILCENLSKQIIIVLSGIMLPLIIALLLIFIEGSIIKDAGFLMVGFNLLASFKDFQDIGFSKNISITLTIIGLFFIMLGVTFLARSRINEEVSKIIA